jgi:hypothetical protein
MHIARFLLAVIAITAALVAGTLLHAGATFAAGVFITIAAVTLGMITASVELQMRSLRATLEETRAPVRKWLDEYRRWFDDDQAGYDKLMIFSADLHATVTRR